MVLTTGSTARRPSLDPVRRLTRILLSAIRRLDTAPRPFPPPLPPPPPGGGPFPRAGPIWGPRPVWGPRGAAAGASRYGPARLPAPSAGRARVLQARRRMLTMLVALAVAAMACVVTSLTHWWTAIPPVGVLGMYLLVLREAACADAEAGMRAEAHARAQAARVAYERTREARARAARLAQSRAEIIDISDRTPQVSDQPYDQYADATVRAVGD